MNANTERDLPAGSPAMSDANPPIAEVAEGIVEQAVAWYVRLASGQQTPQDQAAFAHWLASHAEHARAWQRLQGIGQKLQAARQQLPPAVTRASLARAAQAEPPRRRAFKTLAWAGAGGTALVLLQDQLPWRVELAAALADQSTATGERRSLVLADGSRLMLNTATAVDIRFDALQRHVVLRHGEIMLSTAADRAGRPFRVQTAEGSLQPLGTRFSVRRDAAVRLGPVPGTRLAVLAGAVAVRPAGYMADGTADGTADDMARPPMRVQAGQQLVFTRTALGAIEVASETATAWTDGVLIAERRPLGELIAELSRYRPGRLRCAPEVAQLRITGTWPLDGVDGADPTERVLASLARQLPVRIERRTRYWVTVLPR